MSRPEHGVLVPVADFTSAFVGIKIRTLGCIIDYDQMNATATLSAGRATIQVDVSVPINAGQEADEVRIGSQVFVIGTVEQDSRGNVVIAAARVFDAQDTSLHLWELGARRLSQVLVTRNM